jgi:hypothetical protein
MTKVSEDLEVRFTREVLAAMVKCAYLDAKHVSDNKDPDIRREAEINQESALDFLGSRFFKDYCEIFNLPADSIHIKALK